MPPHPVFSGQDALPELQSPGEPTSVQLPTGVPARHCTHTERSTLANTSLSSPHSGYFPHIPACPFPLSCPSPSWVSPPTRQRCLRQPLRRGPRAIASSLSRSRETSPGNLSCSNATSTTTTRNGQLIMDRLRGCQLQQTWLELWVFV